MGIHPEFQLVREWDCTIPEGECRKQMDKFVVEMNKRRNLAFENCQDDYFLTGYGKALRFSLNFNALIENPCGECLRCNFIGWFDELGFLKNFDYDCIKNEELITSIANEKLRLKQEADNKLAAKTKSITNIRNLMHEAVESGEARLTSRRRAL